MATGSRRSSLVIVLLLFALAFLIGLHMFGSTDRNVDEDWLIERDVNHLVTRFGGNYYDQHVETPSLSRFVLTASANDRIGLSIDHCDPVHIAIPVKRATDALALVKSLLLYRNSQLHFHFIVSSSLVGDVIGKLIDTWELPQVYFSVHVSPGGRMESPSLLKLSIASILPENIDKVIYIDNTFLVAGNIRELWMQFFTKENSDLPFGVYSLKEGLCIGIPSIVLFNLKVMRKFGWNSVAVEHSDENPNTQLCTVAGKFEHFDIPCYWNVNFDNKNYTLACSRVPIDSYKAFDSSTTSFRRIQYFIKFGELIDQYDGSLLSYVPVTCAKSLAADEVIPDLKVNKSEEKLLNDRGIFISKGQDRLMCHLLKKQQSKVFRTLLYYYGDQYIPVEDHETTLVTQFTMNRLRTMRTLIENWNGPVSISMYGSDSDAIELSKFISTFGLLSKRSNINLHMIYKQGDFYPVNYLRNVAIDAVKTPYIFLNDGDFIPMVGLFAYLRQATRMFIDENPKTALVVPAFQTSSFKLNYPKSKRQLISMIRSKSVSTFCPECTHKSHHATNYKVWFKAISPYIINWVERYEPYVVVRTDVVRYDERFMGYGYNKLAHITVLKAQGYRFVALSDVFIIHLPHAPSIDREIWDHDSFKTCIHSVWEDFLIEVKKQYGENCLNGSAPSKTQFLRKVPLFHHK